MGKQDLWISGLTTQPNKCQLNIKNHFLKLGKLEVFLTLLSARASQCNTMCALLAPDMRKHWLKNVKLLLRKIRDAKNGRGLLIK